LVTIQRKVRVPTMKNEKGGSGGEGGGGKKSRVLALLAANRAASILGVPSLNGATRHMENGRDEEGKKGKAQMGGGGTKWEGEIAQRSGKAGGAGLQHQPNRARERVEAKRTQTAMHETSRVHYSHKKHFRLVRAERTCGP